jgi:hypothetical protein
MANFKPFQPIVGTKLTQEEFEDLHLLAAMRNDDVQEIVTELIRKELKHKKALLDQMKTSAPEVLKSLMKSRRRLGRHKNLERVQTEQQILGLTDLIALGETRTKSEDET